MKVFISWSGEDSRRIAVELYEWLPMVVQSIQPYMSSESIDKGTRWASNVANELEGTQVGIVVLTPTNLTAPWINFEAGALAKIVDNARLAPILFGLKPSDIGTPLSQFQVTSFNKDDIFRLLKSINGCAVEEALPEARLEKMHGVLWNDLVNKVEPVIAGFSKGVAEPKKVESELSQVLEELLVLARQQAASMHNTEKLLSPSVVKMVVDIVADQGSSEKDQGYLRSMVRALYQKWRNLSGFDLMDVEVLKLLGQEGKEKLKMREHAVNSFEKVIRDLMMFVEQPRYRGVTRDIMREHETDRALTTSSPERSQAPGARDE